MKEYIRAVSFIFVKQHNARSRYVSRNVVIPTLRSLLLPQRLR